MVDVSTSPTWWTGGRRELKVVLRDAEIDALLARLRRVDDAWCRDLIGKINATLGKKR